MFNFIFHNPTIIHFGKGEIARLGEELKTRKFKKVLVVTGMSSVKKTGIFDEVLGQVKKTGVRFVELAGIRPNPRLESVYEGIKISRKEKVDFIIAVGGGSVIDAAKAIAAGVKYDGDVWDFYEGTQRPSSALPIGTVLTLAATGSEMNANSVITNEEKKRKLPLTAPCLYPVFSILDPAYTFTVNRYHTAAGVADIMAHVFEHYLFPVPDAELQDALAEAILKICIQFGKTVCESPRDYNARANILWASSLALNGIVGEGKASDWTCHMIEHEVSAIYDISHGAGLAILLPAFMQVVMEKYGVEKFVSYGLNVWGIERSKSARKTAEESIAKTKDFFASLGLATSFDKINITNEHFNKIAANAIKERGKLKGFDQLSKEDILKTLKAAS